VLFASYLSGESLLTPDAQRALAALVRTHWGLGSGTLAELLECPAEFVYATATKP